MTIEKHLSEYTRRFTPLISEAEEFDEDCQCHFLS